MQFDLINKQKLLACHIEDGYLITPNGERIKYVVIPNVSWLDSDVKNLLKKAESHGVKVLFYTENGNICNVDFTNTYLNNNYPECEINLANEDGCILATHRAFDTHDLFMLVNTEQADKSINISLSLNDSEELYLVDIPSGEKHALAYTRDKNKANLTLDITALETVVIGRYEKNRNGD